MSDLKKAQELRARREMVRLKQQAAIEQRDMKANAIRSENIARRKKAAAKVGKTFSYKDTVTPSVESGPLNYGSPMKKSSCIKMYDSKGKPAGLMAEGSMAYMESISQEKSNLMQDMPIDNRGISQMSPYKMDHGSPAKETDTNKKPTTMDFNIGSGLVDKKGGRRKEFEKAFATARKAGVKEFTYNVGEEPKKKYTTKLKGE
jgi:hypothetical protein